MSSAVSSFNSRTRERATARALYQYPDRVSFNSRTRERATPAPADPAAAAEVSIHARVSVRPGRVLVRYACPRFNSRTRERATIVQVAVMPSVVVVSIHARVSVRQISGICEKSRRIVSIHARVSVRRNGNGSQPLYGRFNSRTRERATKSATKSPKLPVFQFTHA